MRPPSRAPHSPRYVVDDAGEVWIEGTAAFARRLGYAFPDFDLVGYAVRNLGHIAIGVKGEIASVFLKPAIVAPVTLVAAFQLMAQHRPRRVMVQYLKDGQVRHEICSGQAAFGRLEDLVPAITRDQLQAPYVSEEIDPAHLDGASLARLCPALRFWHEVGGTWTPGFTEELEHVGVGGTTTAVRLPAASERFLIECSGSAYSFLSERWRATFVAGRDFEDQPDREYAAWAAAGYRRVLREARPRIERINALIRTPGQPLRRSRYVRLLLPWTTSCGDRLVSSVGLIGSAAALEQ